MMTVSRRDFLHAGLAIGAVSTVRTSATPPLLESDAYCSLANASRQVLIKLLAFVCENNRDRSPFNAAQVASRLPGV